MVIEVCTWRVSTLKRHRIVIVCSCLRSDNTVASFAIEEVVLMLVVWRWSCHSLLWREHPAFANRWRIRDLNYKFMALIEGWFVLCMQASHIPYHKHFVLVIWFCWINCCWYVLAKLASSNSKGSAVTYWVSCFGKPVKQMVMKGNTVFTSGQQQHSRGETCVGMV